MIAALLLLLFGDPARPSERPVRLADALQFRVDAVAAQRNWNAACDHCVHFEDRSYGWNVGCEWRADANWCRHCWDCLDDVLGGTRQMSISERLRRLDQLRIALGDEAYQMRMMPTPSAGWHFGGLWPEGVTPPSRR